MKEAMTAKDKAKELVDRFLGITYNWQAAKQCALICVDEIINTYPTPWSSLDIDLQKEYWQEVKQEIEKL
jgi:hypothetical protein|tara:strand:+ start:367 stop:576 length:210 start_codon:yes stop_codon:yes gene_type:complete